MKKNIPYIIIAILVIAQLVSIMKVNDLQNQIENAWSEIFNVRNNINNEVSAIYANVEDMLKQQMSLIEQASIEVGEVNADAHSLNITFSLVPKEVSEYTAVSLDFDGESYPMDRNGTTFTVSVTRDIFGNAMPLVVIDENGIMKTTQDERINIRSIRDFALPVLDTSLNGSTGYAGGMYIYNGYLYFDSKAVSPETTITDIRLVTKVDDNVITEEIIPSEMPNPDWQVNKRVPIEKGQVLTMTVIATDRLGYEHHYTVAHWVCGSSVQKEPWFKDEQIYSVDGELLWENEFVN